MVSQTDYIIISLYLFITLFVGFYKGRNIHTMRDYSIANWEYTTPVLVATIFATWVGGESTMGMAENVFSVGAVFIFIFCGSLLNKLIVAQFVAPRMGRFHGFISIGSIMGSLYGKPGRILTGISAAFSCTVILGAQVTGIGYCLEYFLGISYLNSILIGAGTVILYSAFGGVRAVTATDVIQFGILIVAIPLICNIGIEAIGGYSNLFAQVPSSHLRLFPENESPIKYISLFLIFTIPFLNPAIMQRMLMAKDETQMATSLRFAALIEIPFYAIVGFIGFIALIFKPDLEPHLAMPYLIQHILPTGIKGFAISGILAVIMSTADSFLNAGAISLVHDVIQPMTNDSIPDKIEIFLAKVATVLLGVLAIVSAVSFKSILDIVIQSESCWAPLTVFPLYAGIFGFRTTPLTFAVSAAAGVYFVIFWNIFLEDFFGFSSLVPSIIFNMIVFLSVHYIQKARAKDKAAFPPCCSNS